MMNKIILATNKMNTGYRRNITMIEDLPELEDMEVPRPHVNAVRNNYKDSRYPPDAAMRGGIPPGVMPPGSEKYMKYRRVSGPIPREAGMNRGVPSQPEPFFPSNVRDPLSPIREKYTGDGDPSCLQVANHIEDCPICSKFYRKDLTVYIIAIVVLTIICLMLLKKCLRL